MSTSPHVQLVLTGDCSFGRMRVDMESFFEFSFDLTEQLQSLEADWEPFAAPQTPVPAAVVNNVRFRLRS
ncbi:MAG: hypothetical protein NZ789_15935 [Pseudomonadales bacterium]|nr:hypothetical protein [Pseudomonadales bacterium]